MSVSCERPAVPPLPFLFRPGFKLAWFVFSAVTTAGAVWVAESRGNAGFLAPTPADLRRGVAVGAAAGALSLVGSVARRACYRAGAAGRGGSPGPASRTCAAAWLAADVGVPFAVLTGWCVYARVSPGIPLLAMYVAFYPGCRVLERVIGEEPEVWPAEPLAAADRGPDSE